jgi:V8-like Glu-specific endopeptidase
MTQKYVSSSKILLKTSTRIARKWWVLAVFCSLPNTPFFAVPGELPKMKFAKGLGFTSMFGGLVATALIPFMANAQNVASGNVSQQVSPQAAQAANDYWSTERMEKARPISLDASVVGTPKTASTQSPSTIGFPVVGSSGGSAETTTPNTAPAPEPAKSQPVNLKYPFPFTSGFVPSNQYKRFPHRTIGKVFFTMSGVDATCSASAVNSPNKRLIVTAGHCVSNGKGKYHENWMFVPAYNPNNSNPKDREPYGRWPACQKYVTTAFHTASLLAKDLGMVKACDTNGKKLHDVVGYLGYKANISLNQTWYAFGYPAASPFDGNKLAYCKSAYGTTHSTHKTIGIGCNMTGGSSGGPWIVSYSAGKTGAVNYINGLNSHTKTSEPNSMYSPYFGQNFLDLRTLAIKTGA